MEYPALPGSGRLDDFRNARASLWLRWHRVSERHATLTKTAAATFMALVTGALAQIEIHTPLSPVPYTGQVLGIALTAGLLGRRWGTASVGIYLALGAVGVPVFAGQLADFTAFSWWSGVGLFTLAAGTRSLSAGYLLGFFVQAWIVGGVAEGRTRTFRGLWRGFAPLAVAGLLFVGLVDAFVAADYAALFPESAGSFPNPWFALAAGGLVVLVMGVAWLALTAKARRERLELFVANLVGLLALYGIGLTWFGFAWAALGLGPIDVATLLRYTILAFLPIDLTKILLAIGVLTLFRPARHETAALLPTAGSPDDVR